MAFHGACHLPESQESMIHLPWGQLSLWHNGSSSGCQTKLACGWCAWSRDFIQYGASGSPSFLWLCDQNTKRNYINPKSIRDHKERIGIGLLSVWMHLLPDSLADLWLFEFSYESRSHVWEELVPFQIITCSLKFPIKTTRSCNTVGINCTASTLCLCRCSYFHIVT